jgi:predicted nucleic acid-binding protein
MRPVLFDSDAFRCLHGLRLLDVVCAALAQRTSIVLTEYVAHHELNLLQRDVERLERAGTLRIERLLKGTEAATRYRVFQRPPARGGRPPDKGEAEAIAWALDALPPGRALFVTRDDGARRFASEHGVPVTDVMGIVVEACIACGFDRGAAAQALSVWDDREQQLCRPSDYVGFEGTFAVRELQRVTWCEPPSNEPPSAPRDVN